MCTGDSKVGFSFNRTSKSLCSGQNSDGDSEPPKAISSDTMKDVLIVEFTSNMADLKTAKCIYGEISKRKIPPTSIIHRTLHRVCVTRSIPPLK